MSTLAVTCSAPVNIAVLKYWGKRDETLLLPLHASLSVTLDQRDLRTVTSVAASASFDRDRIWLNGKYVCPDLCRRFCSTPLPSTLSSLTRDLREENTENERIQNVFREIRKRIASPLTALDGSTVAPEVARGACMLFFLLPPLTIDLLRVEDSRSNHQQLSHRLRTRVLGLWLRVPRFRSYPTFPA